MRTMTPIRNSDHGSDRIVRRNRFLAVCLGLAMAAVLAFPGRAAAATPPTPDPPYGVDFSVMKNSNPNGVWRLYVQDDAAFDSGIISNGWSLTLITTDPVGLAADVGVFMTVSTNTIAVASNLVFVVGVTNYGPSTASNVYVTDNLPLNADFITNTVTKGSVIHSGSQLTWNVGVLATNQGASMTITVRSPSPAQIINGAICQTVTPDANPDDDAASASATSLVFVAPTQLTGMYIGGAGFQIAVTNTSTNLLVIQASTNFVDWLSIFTNVPPPSSFIFTDPAATNFQFRFYRTLLLP